MCVCVIHKKYIFLWLLCTNNKKHFNTNAIINTNTKKKPHTTAISSLLIWPMNSWWFLFLIYPLTIVPPWGQPVQWLCFSVLYYIHGHKHTVAHFTHKLPMPQTWLSWIKGGKKPPTEIVAQNGNSCLNWPNDLVLFCYKIHFKQIIDMFCLKWSTCDLT